MYRLQTSAGRELEVTPSHPLFVSTGDGLTHERAAALSVGDFLATPRTVPTTADDGLDVDYRRSRSPNAVRLDLPDAWTPSLARLVGYVVAEGYVEWRDDDTGYVSITNNDEEILTDVSRAFSTLGLNSFERDPHPGKEASEVICSAGELVSFLDSLDPSLLEGSAAQRVPDAVAGASRETTAAFLQAYVEGEATVSGTQRELAVASTSRELLADVRRLLLTHGIRSQLHERRNGSHRLRISGEDFDRYVDEIGFVTERKARAAEAVRGGDANTNLDVIPNVGDTLRTLREDLGLTQSDCGLPRSTYQHYERGDRNPSRASLRAVTTAFERRLSELRELRADASTADWDDIEAARKSLGVSQAALGERLGVCQRSVSLYEQGAVVTDGGTVAAAGDAIERSIPDLDVLAARIERLRTFATNDVRWDRIESIEAVTPDYDWVYDLEVQGTHNYLTNGVVSHNSQLLSYIRNIAPRSVYTSGKGSSSAGLTAAAVRDDFGDGQQWTLEAGALVLADKGIAAVDELDKMRPEDRSAMHEGLEQQEISISKAGINATLKSRCSLLGAANPKYGRFDQYEPIGEQIDLEPALISRFDLIFTVTDQPDPEKDADLADHIINTNYAGELHTQRTSVPTSNFTQEQVDAVTEDVAPEIQPDLLRKYIAYAKRTCYPTMTDEAKQAIRDFYVDLRAKGADEDAPVPVTARKLEAIVRLSEASARVRLSDTVELEDAERVIEIVRSCLQDIGVDPETGQFDADVVETGRSKTQRDRVKNIKQLISDIEGEYEEGAPLDEVLDRAEDAGMDRSKAEHEIEKLRRKGEVYEPKGGHLRTT
jgi:replicative DNA helicase Mcm